MERILVVVNLNSRKNRRASVGRRARLQHIVGAWGEVCETHALEELRPLLADRLRRGIHYLVCDGGDGSLHWAMNEATTVLEHAGVAATLPALVPTNGGTIDFVARKAGITGNAERVLARLTGDLAARREPCFVTLDTLEITGIQRVRTGEERPFRRLGFALAAGGIGQRFFDKYYSERRLGARAILSVVGRATASYVADRLRLRVSGRMLAYGRDMLRPTRARVTIDGRDVPTLEHGAINAGAFDVTLGGVVRVFPLARVRGALHFQAGEIAPTEIIRAFPALYRGRSIRSARLVDTSGTEMTVDALGDELLSPIIDGERVDDVARLRVRCGPAIRVPVIAG
jgi:hypothetical protein